MRPKRALFLFDASAHIGRQKRTIRVSKFFSGWATGNQGKSGEDVLANSSFFVWGTQLPFAQKKDPRLGGPSLHWDPSLLGGFDLRSL